MTGQPRLFADYAAAPTPSESRAAVARNRAAQLDMFDVEPDRNPTADACPVCASTNHVERDCPHGTAPTLTTPDPAAVRAMFASFGWTTSTR